MNSVALVKHKQNFKETLEEGLDGLGGFCDLISPIIIKPNICTINDDTGFSVTNVEVIKALAEIILEQDENISIKIIESDSQSKFAEEAFEKFGYKQLCKEMQKAGFDVATVNLSKSPLVQIEFIGDYFENPELPDVIVEKGYFISVAAAKTHYLSFITGVLKNLFGVLPRKNQAFYHPKIDEVIVDLARIIRPSFNIVDARVGVEGWNGPKTRRLDAFILGRGAVSVDATMARIMGFKPEQIRHIMNSYNYDLGPIDPTVVGESIETLAVEFNPPRK
ncbi:MAG: DUF362 domain-containing protein [Candidatus Thorarchaeota archaeon]|nr:MAG: DUF362 domain-containing protein [Candidatus Thorarchaeota archaeon]